MQQKIVIIGAGINGLISAYVLNFFNPELRITLLDAGPEPKFTGKKTFLKGHIGATLGHSRDARQFTGTEGLAFQNPVHTKLIYKASGPNSNGWRNISEEKLTMREKAWRQELLDRYDKNFTVINSPYNKIYTSISYGGMEAWSFLKSLDKNIAKYCSSSDYVYVAFESKEELEADYDSETAFNPFGSDPKKRVVLADLKVLYGNKNAKVNAVYSKLLRVPGSAWSIQSLWRYLYLLLRKKENIEFKWNNQVDKTKDLPDAQIYLWTAGSGHITPEIYLKHGRVQGLGGVWLTVSNPGFKKPFKISAPQPNGYINLTPDGKLLHISGGFGWTGERSFKDSSKLLKSVEVNLINHLSVYLGIPKGKLRRAVSGYCIRPTTPTGLPDISSFTSAGKRHIMISGAGKAGSTQSSILALYVAKSLGIDLGKKWKVYRKNAPESYKVIDKAMSILENGLEPDSFRSKSRKWDKNEYEPLRFLRLHPESLL